MVDNFQKVFTKRLSTANITKSKADEKLLDDEQYVPPPGHFSFLKGKSTDGAAGDAYLLSLGGTRMQESRTWKTASDFFARNLSWSSGNFVFGDLQRLNSFKVTTSNNKVKKCSGSVTASLFGATFVDLEPEESNNFHLLVVFGEDVDRFCSNNALFEIKGYILKEEFKADVTKWLPNKVVYREFQIPEGWSDGSEYVQQGDVPSARSGAKIGILSKAGQSFTMDCTGGVCKPTPGPTRLPPADSNIFLLQYPGMTWTKLPSIEQLRRSHHSQYIVDSSVYIIGGYSWSENKAKKLFPITELTRITFSEDFRAVHQIEIIQLESNSPNTFSPFISGFACVGWENTVWLYGGIPFPEYDPEKENLFKFLPPETPRNRVPTPASQLCKISLPSSSLSVISGPAEAGSHNGSMQILNNLEPLLVLTCDPYVFIYRPV